MLLIRSALLLRFIDVQDLVGNVMKKTLAAQGIFLTGERLISLVSQASAVILISRFLGQEVFGEYAVVLTWTALFQMIANFGLSECISREIGKDLEGSQRLVSHSLMLTIIIAAISSCVMLLAASLAQYPSRQMTLLQWAILILFPASTIATCRAVLIGHKRVEYMLLVAAAENLLFVPAAIYCALHGADLLYLIGAIIASKVTAALLSLIIVHRVASPILWHFDRQILSGLFFITVPFGLNSLIVFPFVRFDIILLSKMTTMAAVGVYSAAAKLMEVLLVVPIVFFAIMLPQVARHMTHMTGESLNRLQLSFERYFMIVMPIGVGAICFAQPAILLLYGAAFVDSVLLLKIHMVAYLILTIDVAFSLVLKAAGFQKNDLYVSIVTAASNILLNLFLIPPYGVIGASIALVSTVLVSALLRFGFLSRYVVSLKWMSFIQGPLLLSVGVTTTIVLLNDLVPFPVLGILYVVCYAGLAMAFLNAGRTLLKEGIG